MVRDMHRNHPNFITTSLLPPAPHVYSNDDDEEFHEYDVVWSDNNYIKTTLNSVTSTPPCISSPRSYTAGISAALLADDLPRSPTSIQRKTSSSPVSMISSSFLATNITSTCVGSSAGGGPKFGSSRFHMSAPVNVPVWPNNRPKFGVLLDEDEDEVQDNDEMVPPHEIVARSSNTTPFSVVEGVGRTLKGRDLTKVRNAVFRKTGFLD